MENFSFVSSSCKFVKGAGIAIILALLCFSNDLFAGGSPVHKSLPINGRSIRTDNISPANKKNELILPPPTISFATPQTYLAGFAIAPLTPAGTGRAILAYSTPATLLSGLNKPNGIAIDPSDNIYHSSKVANIVYKLAEETSMPVNYGTGFNAPGRPALDASGNLYVAHYGNNEFKKIPSGDGAPVSLGFRLKNTNYFVFTCVGYSCIFALIVLLKGRSKLFLPAHNVKSLRQARMQLPGTYFYAPDFSVKGITKRKTGFIVLKY